MALLKMAWRFAVAVKDLLVLLLLMLFFGTLYAILTAMPGERPHMQSAGALLLDLDGVVVEQPAEGDPLALLTGAETPMHEYRLRDLVTALEATRTDPKVKAVVLDLDGFLGGGQVSMQRLGQAIDGVKAAKKPVLAFATAYEDSGYQLAAHASEIWLNPIGAVGIMGPGGSRLYYKGLLDRLGVTAHVYRVGSFKSAVEPFIRTGQSPEAEQAARALAGALWDNWLADVSKARPRAKLRDYAMDPVRWAEEAKGDMAKAALSAGLVDRLGDDSAFAERVTELAGEAPDDGDRRYAALDLDLYAKAHGAGEGGSIGVLTVAGDIVDGDAGPGVAAGDRISGLLRDALDEQDLKALVVRIDSPGGSVLASEKIRGAVAEAKKRGLPVVVSMGDVAASGGYWIATAADEIFAQPSTITGSIGVFGLLPSFEGTLAKIGVTTDGVTTTPLSGQPDLAGGTNAAFDRMAQLGVEDVYRRFLTLVAQARRLPVERVADMAEGRVWDGGTARQLGLVDRFGGLDAAIARAAELAKLDPKTARPHYIEPDLPEWAMLAQWLGADEARAAMPADLLGRQAWRRQAQAATVIVDLRLMAQGAALRADCMECRGFAVRPGGTMPHVSGWPETMLRQMLR